MMGVKKKVGKTNCTFSRKGFQQDVFHLMPFQILSIGRLAAAIQIGRVGQIIDQINLMPSRCRFNSGCFMGR